MTDEGILQTVLEHLKFFKNPKGKRKLLQRLTGNENLAFLQNHNVLKWITDEALDNLNKVSTFLTLIMHLLRLNFFRIVMVMKR